MKRAVDTWTALRSVAQKPAGQACIAVGLLALTLAFRTIDDLDLGTHLATGRWLLQHAEVPRTDPFTWTITKHAYVAYHWLFQILAFLVERESGPVGLVVLRVAFVGAIAALLTAAARFRSVAPVWGATCGLVALVATEPRFAIRPELFTYLFLAMTVWLIERRRAGHAIPIWSFALIQLLWINTHIYVLGWLPMLLYAAGHTLRTRSLDRWLAKAYGLAALALLLNPYGLQAVAYPFVGLFSRMDQSNVFSTNIAELVSPFRFILETKMLGFQLLAYQVFLVAAAIALVIHLRNRRWEDAVLILIWGGLSTLALRNIPLFTLGAWVAVTTGLTQCSPNILRSEKVRAVVARTVMVGCAAIALSATAGTYYRKSARPVRAHAEYDTFSLAMRAADFVERNRLRGRGLNDINLGGVLEWRAPTHKVFIDGRNEVSGEAFFRHHGRLMSASGFDRMADRYGFQWVALKHAGGAELPRHLAKHPNWRLVYLDGPSLVAVRRNGANNRVPDLALPMPMNAGERWKALRQIRSRSGWQLLRTFWETDKPPGDAYFSGLFLMHVGRTQEAERPLLAALAEHPQTVGAWNTTGDLYRLQREYAAAAYCYQQSLNLAPHDQQVAGLVEALRRDGFAPPP